MKILQNEITGTQTSFFLPPKTLMIKEMGVLPFWWCLDRDCPWAEREVHFSLWNMGSWLVYCQSNKDDHDELMQD
jgi:hypothetical protein